MTTNAKPRLMLPSEIELWELAKKATPPPPLACGVGVVGWEHRALDAMSDSERVYIVGASPDKIAALLETLEKTRRALSMYRRTVAAWRHIPDFRDHCPFCAVTVAPHGHYKGTPCPIGQLCDLDDDAGIAALLAGFSGDASKEEK